MLSVNSSISCLVMNSYPLHRSDTYMYHISEKNNEKNNYWPDPLASEGKVKLERVYWPTSERNSKMKIHRNTRTKVQGLGVKEKVPQTARKKKIDIPRSHSQVTQVLVATTIKELRVLSLIFQKAKI